MIVCPKCKTENMLGAIFCRGCGEKLNIDELRPEDIARAIQSKTKKGTSILRNLIAFILLVAVLGTLAAIFIPPAYTPMDELPEADFMAARTRMTTLLRAKPGEQYRFTAAEVNHLAKHTVDLTREGIEKRAEAIAKGELKVEGFSVPYDLNVELLGENRVRLVLLSKLYDKVPLHTVVEGVVSGSPDGGLWFVPDTFFAGRLPVYGQIFQDAVLQRFLALIEQNQKFQDDLRPKIGGVTVSATEATLQR